MVAPWDAQRRRPDPWKSDEPLKRSNPVTEDPPQLIDRSDLPTPPNSDVERDLPLPPNPDGPLSPSDKKPELGNRKPTGSQRQPLALFGVTLAIAALVFLGLRVVRVNISSNSGTASRDVDLAVTETTSELLNDAVSTTIVTAETPSESSDVGKVDWVELARSVVYFEVGGNCQWVGSGTLILDGSYVLTNWHVSGGGECPLRVGLTDSPSAPPTEFHPATVVIWDSQIDLAIVRLQNSVGAPYIPPGRKPVSLASAEVRLGDQVKLLGYPVVREDQFESAERYTLTLTDGSVSGTENFGERSGYAPTDAINNEYEVWGEYIKHTAKQNGGVSGGGAFNSAGELVAIPTAGDEKLELMRSVRFAKILIEKITK